MKIIITRTTHYHHINIRHCGRKVNSRKKNEYTIDKIKQITQKVLYSAIVSE